MCDSEREPRLIGRPCRETNNKMTDSLPLSKIFSKKWLVIVGAVLLIVFLKWIMSKPQQPSESAYLRNLFVVNATSANGCRAPVLDPWDPSIRHYYSVAKPLRCKSLQSNALFLSADGVLRRTESGENLRCRYQTFEYNSGVGDAEPRYDSWTELPREGARIRKDFVEAECYRSFVKIYRDHFNQIVEKNQSSFTHRTVEKSSVDRPSVLVFGMDSMSRSNVIRQLPLTRAKLLKMGFVEMLNHIKIGDNTIINWAAILAGIRMLPTKEFPGEMVHGWEQYVSGWKLIWKRFSNESYVTYLAEDRPDLNTLNPFLQKSGFLYPPTDHYYRPFASAIFNTLTRRRSTVHCYDGRPNHRLQLNYLQRFLETYSAKRLFAWNWFCELSHDYLNTIGAADDDFAAFFEGNKRLLQDTIVIVVSDHGQRFDRIRETLVFFSMIGRMESRLPYLAIRIPQRLRARYPSLEKRLAENAERLSTPFDLHETLQDILKGEFSDRFSSHPPPSGRRAYSLLQRTPEKRSCFESNIPEDYCPCVTEKKISFAQAAAGANALVEHLNRLIENVGKLVSGDRQAERYRCSRLELDAITFASVRVLPRLTGDDQASDTVRPSQAENLIYRIESRLKPPSNALVEAIITENANGHLAVSNEIERNNKYGNTSHCVKDLLLKKICHCIKLAGVEKRKR